MWPGKSRPASRAGRRGGFGMKRNANEKYSGRQGDAAEDGRAGGGGGGGGEADEKCRFGSWWTRLPCCRLVRAQVFSQPLISRHTGGNAVFF